MKTGCAEKIQLPLWKIPHSLLKTRLVETSRSRHVRCVLNGSFDSDYQGWSLP